MEDKLKYIAEKLGAEELLCQLAEEAAELSQAALKLRRAINGNNPTPKSQETCWNSLIEEIADCELCLFMLIETNFLKKEIDDFLKMTDDIKSYKTDRWLERLKEKEK